MSELKEYAMPDGRTYQLDAKAAEQLQKSGQKIKEVKRAVKKPVASTPLDNSALAAAKAKAEKEEAAPEAKAEKEEAAPEAKAEESKTEAEKDK